MAETFVLEAQPRTITGKKVSQLRSQGLVPVVVYGARRSPLHLQIPYRALQVMLLKAGGTHLIDLQVESATVSVLAREVQRHILRGDIIHVDFMAVDADTPISTEVPIHVIGESPAVEGRLGIILMGVSTIQIEALPRDLIDRIDVDISNLKHVGDTIHIRDLSGGDKVTILDDPDEMVVRIVPVPAAKEEEEEVEAPIAAEPEVIAKGKIEEEEEG